MEVNGTAEGYFSEATEEQNQVDQELLKKGGSSVSTASPSPPTSSSGCFDCNICLDFAVDPVVTLCGHLYCWPCIYKWLQVDTSSVHQCPVCKASLSEDSLVPLYGRGHTTKQSHQSIEIPRRPSSRHHDQTIPESDISRSADEDLYANIHHPMRVHRHRHQHYHLHQHEHHHHYPLGDYLSSAQPSSPSLGSTRMVHSTAGGVLGGMAIAVLPWVFRNHQEAMSMHYSSPFSTGANGNSPRLRRQEMEVEMSLHQIWLFLFCCAVLCLLLF